MVDELVIFCGYAYDRAQIIEMEALLLTRFEFSFTRSTCALPVLRQLQQRIGG